MERSNKTIYLARIVSGIAHPILIPLYAVFIIFHSQTYLDYTPAKLIRSVYLIIAISTVLLPLSVLPLLKLQKVVSNYALEKRKERILPLLLAAIFYTLGYYSLRNIPFLYIISCLLLAATISIVLVALVSLKWKISIHLAAIGGLTGMLVIFNWLFKADCRIYFMAAILFSGLLAAARLKLNLHTPTQVYIGFLLGFITVSVVMIIMLTMRF